MNYPLRKDTTPIRLPLLKQFHPSRDRLRTCALAAWRSRRAASGCTCRQPRIRERNDTNGTAPAITTVSVRLAAIL